MMTTVVSQCEGWHRRTDAEIKCRLEKIKQDGNLLHGFNRLTPPKNPAPLRVIYEDRRTQDADIAHEDRRFRVDRRNKTAPPPNCAKVELHACGK